MMVSWGLNEFESQGDVMRLRIKHRPGQLERKEMNEQGKRGETVIIKQNLESYYISLK